MCVCVSVCLSVWSVTSHLTSGASVRPENPVTYSAGNGGQNICGVFARLQRSRTPPLKTIRTVAAESAHAYLANHALEIVKCSTHT